MNRNGGWGRGINGAWQRHSVKVCSKVQCVGQSTRSGAGEAKRSGAGEAKGVGQVRLKEWGR